MILDSPAFNAELWEFTEQGVKFHHIPLKRGGTSNQTGVVSGGLSARDMLSGFSVCS